MANVKNLKPCKKGETHNPNGRPKKLVNAIKGLPANMKEEVYGILGYALTLKSEEEAKAYLEEQTGRLGQYGFLMQIAVRQLTAKGWGWGAAMDILDRLYGKPKQATDVTHTGEASVIVVRSQEEGEKIKGMGELTI